MYNRKLKFYQIDLEYGDELTESQIQNLISDHQSHIVPVMDRLDCYSTGYNKAIKQQPNKDPLVPNNRKAYAYGKRIVDTTTNYLISNPAKYDSKDTEFLQEIENLQSVNSDTFESKEIVHNLVRFGKAGKLFYYDFTTSGGQPILRYASIDPRNFIAVYNYDVNPRMIALIHYYDIDSPAGVDENDNTRYVNVYSPSTRTMYEGTASAGGYELIDSIPHPFSQVPFADYGGKDYSGLLYPVLDQIDAYDKLQNLNLNEIEKHDMAYLVSSVDIDPETLAQAKEMGAFVLPSGTDATKTLTYLTKDINAEFNLNVRDNAKQEIFDLSTVPDFMSPDFAAQSGVALRYKLIGFDNSARQVEEYFKLGEQKSIDVMTEDIDSTWQSRESYYLQYPERIVSVELTENIPTDQAEQINAALSLKALNMPIDRIIAALPVSLVGNDKEAVIEAIEAAAPDISEDAMIEETETPELEEEEIIEE